MPVRKRLPGVSPEAFAVPVVDPTQPGNGIWNREPEESGLDLMETRVAPEFLEYWTPDQKRPGPCSFPLYLALFLTSFPLLTVTGTDCCFP